MIQRIPAMLAALVLSTAGLSAMEWKLQRIDGRDYVSIDQVAEFYNLPRGVAPDGKTVSLARGKRSLKLTQDSRQIAINGVNYWMSFPVIQRENEYWISRMDLGKSIEPAFRPELVPDIKPFTTVILDPGHGGQDKGAVGPYEFEKNFALDVARRVRNELQKAGLHVVMTRNSDTFIELHDRAAMANAKLNSIFVSLHFNASPNLAATGLEIFCVTPRGSPSTEYDELLVRDMVQEFGNDHELQSFSLASAIYHALHGAPLNMFDRGLKRARFAVLRLTKMPAVLVEGGFLSNRNDARQIASKEWRDNYARAIAAGILEYRKLADLKVPPRLAADYRTAKPPAAPVATPAPAPARAGAILRDLPEEKSSQEDQEAAGDR